MTNEKDGSSLRVTVEDIDNCRIDRYISENLGLFSRSQIKNRNLRVYLNNKETKLSKKVSLGDVLEVFYSHPVPLEIKPEKIPLNIIFENRDVIVLDKPQGLVVHPAPGNYTGTMVQGLLYYLQDLHDAFPHDILRPGIVHRLDKDTSGIIIAAKHPDALEFLSRQFREKTTEKKYIALVKGVFKKRSGVIETFIARDKNNRKKFAVYEYSGKKAKTEYHVLSTHNGVSLVVLSPYTGRTHQLRVHMNYTGHPIIGDPLYGRKSKEFPDSTMLLHALQLRITLPGEIKLRTFRTDIPERFKTFHHNETYFQDILKNFPPGYPEYQD